MKKLALLTLGLSASLLTAQAQTFTQGNLCVIRLSGYDTTSSVGDAVFIDQYTTSGTLVSSFAVPTSGANSLLLNGEPYEGLMTLTPAGTNLVFSGFNIALASSSANLLNSTSAQAPRSIASVDAYGNFSLPIKDSTHFSTYTPLGAASDGTNFWLSANGPPTSFGAGTGGYPQVVYMGTAASPAFLQVATNTFSSTLRGVNIFYNTTASAYGLFVSATSSNTPTANIYHGGTFVLSNLSSAPPLASTGASNYFPNATAAGANTAAYDIAVNPAGTIAYEADDDQGIVKYTYSGGVWVSNYTILLTNAVDSIPGTPTFSATATSVTADWTQTPPMIYATTAESLTNRLVKVWDTNSSGQDVVVNLAQYATVNGVGGSTNTFRGVRFAPFAYGYVSVPPVAFVGNPGQTATFSATILGSPTPSIQWYSNSVANPNTWVLIPGATTATLTLPSITTAQSGSLFYVQASNIYGSSTNVPVALIVNNPAISSQPVGATNLVGGSSVTLSVSAVGTGTLSYQWYANGVSLGSAGGAQTSSYTVPSGLSASSTTYYVVVTNSTGPTSTQSASTVVSYTPYLLYDYFAYGNLTSIFTVPGSPWYDINGTSPQTNLNNNSVVISESDASDAFSPFIEAIPESSGTIISSSFVLNVKVLPTNAGGVYFANLEGAINNGSATNTPDFNFAGCIYILTSNNPALFTAIGGNPGNLPSVAYPGTYRIGIAATNADYSASTATGGPTAVVALDMATNINYQIVFTYDLGNKLATVAVNPDIAADPNATYFENNDPTAASGSDFYAFTNIGVAGFGLRQRIGEGVMDLSQLEVSLDNTDINGFATVTSWVGTPGAPVVGLNPTGFTDYPGGVDTMGVAASDIGEGSTLTYAWYVNSGSGYTLVNNTGDITGATTPTLSFGNLAAGDAGTYYCLVTGNGSTASGTAVVNVNLTPTPPFFVSPPTPTTTTNISITVDTGVTMTALAQGSGPITYAWHFNNGVNGNPQVATGPSYTISSAAVNQSGTYTVVATGTTSPAATSPNYVLTVNPPLVIPIGTLRTNYLNTSAAPTISVVASYPGTVFSITGICTVATNFVSGQQFYLQDATGGIQCYVSSGGASQPKMGDEVTAIGTIEVYDNALELDMESIGGNPPYTIINTSGEGLPMSQWPIPLSPIVLPSPTYLTANAAAADTGILGSIVEVTNAYFEAYTGTATFAGNTDYALSNITGNIVLNAELYTSEKDITAGDGQLFGTLIPKFAYSIIGPIDNYDTTWELYATTLANIVTAAPPAVNVAGVISGGGSQVTLTWTAVPYKYTYSILSSTTVNGTYTKLASGLMFSTTSGTYTDTAPGSTTKFYQIVSP